MKARPHLIPMVCAAVLALAATGSDAQTAYTIGNNGNQLVRFDVATGGVSLVVPVTGAVTNLAGIDFRPADGLLYGFDNTTGGRLVTVDPITGVTTLVSTSGTNSTTGNMGVDFNPVADRLRLVNELDQNLRINVATGAAIVDTTLAFAAGDTNFGVNPSIIDAAYTNSDPQAAATMLYYIDNVLEALVTTSNPNAGLLTTVGSLGAVTNDRTGFDILFSGGLNTAYALLTSTAGVASIATIDLSTGAATDFHALGAAAIRPYGLAILPQAAAVPEPPAMFLVGLGLAGLAASRRRKSN